MNIIEKIIKISGADQSWYKLLSSALSEMDQSYLSGLLECHSWLPGAKQLLNAFSLPLPKVQYILLGESPYPRVESANGYAFWDANVDGIWSDTGMSKQVNRATSLRNFIKMLMVADGRLSGNDTNQTAIADANKAQYVQTNSHIFNNLLKHGFLLLNATLVLSDNKVSFDAKQWRPFINKVLMELLTKNQDITLILFGKIAEMVDKITKLPNTARLYVEHPYNITFINNKNVLDFFRPFRLLYS